MLETEAANVSFHPTYISIPIDGFIGELDNELLEFLAQAEIRLYEPG